jgi:ankyrin repeat protein
MSDGNQPAKKLCPELDEAVKALEEEKKGIFPQILFSNYNFTSLVREKSINNIKIYIELIDFEKHKKEIMTTIMKETLYYQYDVLFELTELLKNAGLNWSESNSLNFSSLKCAIMNRHTNLAKILINYKVDLNKDYPLHNAISYRNTEIAKELILNGADVNLQSDDELNTPIMLAAYYHNTEIFNMLFTNPSVDLSAKNKYGCNLLMSACNNMSPVNTSNHVIINSLLSLSSIVDDINYKNKYGNTALNIMASNINDYSRLAIITLLDAGADPNIPDKNGDTPLLNLAKSEYNTPVYNVISCMITILNQGADINYTNNNGETIYRLMPTNIKEYFEICYTFARKNINKKIFINTECVICNEKETKMVLLEPCQHIVTCFKCFQNLEVFSANNETFCKCPMCNTNISNHTIVEYLN